MTHDSTSQLRLTMNPVALGCYATAICSFGCALVGLVSSHFPSTGLAIVGGLYLVVGTISQLSASPAVRLVSQGISQQTAGADNLIPEMISASSEAEFHGLAKPELAVVTR